jgi:hypothetical protein
MSWERNALLRNPTQLRIALLVINVVQHEI